MQVYPAANLVNFATYGTPIYFIDPRPSISSSSYTNLNLIAKTAVEGVPTLVADLIDTKR